MARRGPDLNLTEYHIRPASERDVKGLRVIEQRASELFLKTPFADEFSQECLPSRFLNEQIEAGRLWVVANQNDLPVGFAAAILIDGFAHLHEVSVDPGHGKKGLGRRLVETVCDWARDAGHSAITLSTFREVPWNAPFYQRMGFRILDESELGPGLLELLEEEAESGLDTANRVFMKREL